MDGEGHRIPPGKDGENRAAFQCGRRKPSPALRGEGRDDILAHNTDLSEVCYVPLFFSAANTISRFWMCYPDSAVERHEILSLIYLLLWPCLHQEVVQAGSCVTNVLPEWIGEGNEPEYSIACKFLHCWEFPPFFRIEKERLLADRRLEVVSAFPFSKKNY